MHTVAFAVAWQHDKPTGHIDVINGARGGQTIQQRIEHEPEETHENACNGNRVEKCPTWLGLSRDMRFFEVGHHSGYYGFPVPRLSPRACDVLPIERTMKHMVRER